LGLGVRPGLYQSSTVSAAAGPSLPRHPIRGPLAGPGPTCDPGSPGPGPRLNSSVHSRCRGRAVPVTEPVPRCAVTLTPAGAFNRTQPSSWWAACRMIILLVSRQWEADTDSAAAVLLPVGPRAPISWQLGLSSINYLLSLKPETDGVAIDNSTLSFRGGSRSSVAPRRGKPGPAGARVHIQNSIQILYMLTPVSKPEYTSRRF
jgi:hypothetical protein